MLQQVGLHVVLNATESPLWETHAPADGCKLEVRPLIVQRPNTPFFEWLRRNSQTFRLQGWVLLRQTWCDLFHAEVVRLKSETSLPWLDLETGAYPALEALHTRAEAFAERLHACRKEACVSEEGYPG
jgi:hypothetical protein